MDQNEPSIETGGCSRQGQQILATGVMWAYSNLGYAILKEVIHRVADRPWTEFFTERIFKPIGMNTTRTADLIEIVPNRAAGYQFRDNTQRNALPLTAGCAGFAEVILGGP